MVVATWYVRTAQVTYIAIRCALEFKDGTRHHSQTSPTGTVYDMMMMVWYTEAKTFFQGWCIIRRLLN